jgi:hypothetical protein
MIIDFWKKCVIFIKVSWKHQNGDRTKFIGLYVYLLIFIDWFSSSIWELKNTEWQIKGRLCMWAFRFSRRRVWRWLSSGMLRRVVSYKLTDVSEVLTASRIRAILHDDDGGSKHLWSVGQCLRDYTVPHPRRQSYSRLCMNCEFSMIGSRSLWPILEKAYCLGTDDFLSERSLKFKDLRTLTTTGICTRYD